MRNGILSVIICLASLAGCLAAPSLPAFAASFPEEDVTSVSRYGGPAVYEDGLVFDPRWYSARHPEEYALLGYDDSALCAWFVETGRKSDPRGVCPLFYAGDWRMDLLNYLDVAVRRRPELKSDDTPYFALEDLTADGYPELIFWERGMQTVVTSSATDHSYSEIRGRKMHCSPATGLFFFTDGIGTACCRQAVDGVFVASDAFAECLASVPAAAMSLRQVTMELSLGQAADPENYLSRLGGPGLRALSEVRPDPGYYDTNIGGTALYHRAGECLAPEQLQAEVDAWNSQPAAVREWLMESHISIYLSAAQKLTPTSTGFSRAGEYILLALNHEEAAGNILIHEIGHQVSEGMYRELTGEVLSEQSAWQSLYARYRDEIAAFTPVGAYNVYEAEEAFAETWVLYTTDPEGLKERAPALHDFVVAALGEIEQRPE